MFSNFVTDKTDYMKTKNLVLPVAAAMTALTSCGPRNEAPKVLVLYYSQTATTEAVAREIQQKLGADIEKFDVEEPYDGTFQETVTRGLSEKSAEKLPKIKPLKSDLDSYDIIFLGYPIWFGTFCNPVESLLEQVDLSGKTIVPFCTFGSGGLVESTAALKAKLPDSKILPGYGVRTSRLESMPVEVDWFLKSNGFIDGDYAQLEEFGEEHPASAEEAAVFDAAIAGYDRIHATASTVSSRPVPGGTEYLFTAEDMHDNPVNGTVYVPIKVYVLALDGKAPEFTLVVR